MKKITRCKKKSNCKRREQLKLKEFFNSQVLCPIEELAKKTGFIQRASGKLSALSFLFIFTCGSLGKNLTLLQLKELFFDFFGIDIRVQSLFEKINQTSTLRFLKAYLKRLIEHKIKEIRPSFYGFNRIVIEDSSLISLRKFKRTTPSRGLISRSSLKLDVIFDVVNQRILNLDLFKGTDPDQSLGSNLLKFIRKGDLIIRDLGYFKLEAFRKMVEKGAFFISKLNNKTLVYLNEEANALDLLQFLKEQAKINPQSQCVYLGANKDKFRLVYRKAPSRVVRQRLKRYKQQRRKEPDGNYIKWAHYTLLITNIEESISNEAIYELYRLRWQIELFFKNIKSNLCIHLINGTKKTRMKAIIYGRLIGLFILFNFIEQINVQQRELSLYKLTKWLMDDNRFIKAIVEDRLDRLLRRIHQNIEQHCKQKRRRKTSLEITKECFEEEMVA